MHDATQAQLNELPDASGVYVMRDGRGRVVYVGKAESLKRRVPAHFDPKRDDKADLFDAEVEDIELIAASISILRERERLLIRRYKPRLNTQLVNENYKVRRRQSR